MKIRDIDDLRKRMNMTLRAAYIKALVEEGWEDIGNAGVLFGHLRVYEAEPIHVETAIDMQRAWEGPTLESGHDPLDATITHLLAALATNPHGES